MRNTDRRRRADPSGSLLLALLCLTGLALPGACTLNQPDVVIAGGGNSSAGSGGRPLGTQAHGGDGGEPGRAMPGTSGGSNVSGGLGGSNTNSAGATDYADAGEGGSGTSGPEQGGGASGGSASGGSASGNGGSGNGGSGNGGSGGSGGASGSGPDPYSGPFKVLVLEKTLGFRHDSIPLCESLLTELGKTADGMMPPGTKPGSQFTVTIANDNLSEFTDAGLTSYALVFSCSPTGNVFSDSANPNGTVGMAALQKFVEGGQAWAGVHAALDFEKTGGFPWYTDTLTGAYMASHDVDGTGWNVTVPGAFASHPVVSGVPNPWSATDEWYNLSKDIETLPGFTIVQKLPDNRPVTWVKNVSKGRMFYTVRGHNKTVYGEASFKRLLLNGVLWATRRLN